MVAVIVNGIRLFDGHFFVDEAEAEISASTRTAMALRGIASSPSPLFDRVFKSTKMFEAFKSATPGKPDRACTFQ